MFYVLVYVVRQWVSTTVPLDVNSIQLGRLLSSCLFRLYYIWAPWEGRLWEETSQGSYNSAGMLSYPEEACSEFAFWCFDISFNWNESLPEEPPHSSFSPFYRSGNTFSFNFCPPNFLHYSYNRIGSRNWQPVPGMILSHSQWFYQARDKVNSSLSIRIRIYVTMWDKLESDYMWPCETFEILVTFIVNKNSYHFMQYNI